MSYTKQTWDTTSYVTPTRMNHIEDGVEEADTVARAAASAAGTSYDNTSSGLSATDTQGAIDEITVKYALITFTIPSSGSTYNFTSLTPSGFNTSNCYPIVRAVLADAWYFDPSLLSVYFAGTAFMVSFPENYRGRDCKILLAKPTTIII